MYNTSITVHYCSTAITTITLQFNTVQHIPFFGYSTVKIFAFLVYSTTVQIDYSTVHQRQFIFCWALLSVYSTLLTYTRFVLLYIYNTVQYSNNSRITELYLFGVQYPIQQQQTIEFCWALFSVVHITQYCTIIDSSTVHYFKKKLEI